MKWLVTITPEGSRRKRFEKAVTAESKGEAMEYVNRFVLPVLHLTKPVIRIRKAS